MVVHVFWLFMSAVFSTRQPVDHGHAVGPRNGGPRLIKYHIFWIPNDRMNNDFSKLRVAIFSTEPIVTMVSSSCPLDFWYLDRPKGERKKPYSFLRSRPHCSNTSARPSHLPSVRGFGAVPVKKYSSCSLTMFGWSKRFRMAISRSMRWNGSEFPELNLQERPYSLPFALCPHRNTFDAAVL